MSDSKVNPVFGHALAGGPRLYGEPGRPLEHTRVQQGTCRVETHKPVTTEKPNAV